MQAFWKIAAILVSVIFTMVCVVGMPTMIANTIKNYRDHEARIDTCDRNLYDFKLEVQEQYRQISVQLERIEGKL